MARNSLKYDLNVACLQGAELSDQTIRNYKSYNAHFRDFCISEGLNTFAKVKAQGTAILDAYAHFLQSQGKSASTVHAYLSAPCRALGISMDRVDKPRRVSAEGARASGAVSDRSDREALDPRYNAAVAFNRAVGIRRAELARLTGADLCYDWHGNRCVRVVRGKGGKSQLQVILPQYVETVERAFAGKGANDRVFPPETLSRNINYHHQRAKLAQEAYAHYADLIARDPQARVQIIGQLVDRYADHLVELLDAGKISGAEYDRKLARFQHSVTKTDPVILRGSSRRLALDKGYVAKYDRTALYAVSVLHLSHWRIDVTVSHYMIK